VDAQELALLVENSEARAYASLIQAAPQAFLAAHGLRVVPVGSATAVVAQSVTNTVNMNRVIGLGVAEPATDAMIGQIVDIYGVQDLSFGVELAPCAQPKELPDWLRARRMRRGGTTAIQFRPAKLIESSACGLSVARAPASARESVAQICCDVFRMPPAAHGLIAATADIPKWRHWLAYSGNSPVAAALSFVDSGVAWLGWDATLPEARGQGAQLALIAARVNDAVASGCKYVTAETPPNTSTNADPSYRNYERSGFSVAYERLTYVALRTAKKASGSDV
jgi:GNAT superfamily N-acetyltransferase